MVSRAVLETLAGTLGLGAHVIRVDPAQIGYQLAGRLANVAMDDEVEDVERLRSIIDSSGGLARGIRLGAPGGSGSLTISARRTLLGAEISPDGTTIVTAHGSGWVQVWDAASGMLRREFEGPVHGALSLRFLGPNRIVCGSRGGEVSLFDLDFGEHLTSYHLGEGVSSIIAVLPNEATVLAGLRSLGPDHEPEPTATLIDVVGGEIECRYRGHSESPRAGAVSPDGGWIYSGDATGAVHRWSPRTGTGDEWLPAGNLPIQRIVALPYGRRVVVIREDYVDRDRDGANFVVIDSATGAVVEDSQIGKAARPYSLGDGRLLLVSGGVTEIVDLDSGDREPVPIDVGLSSMDAAGAWGVFGTFEGQISLLDLISPDKGADLWRGPAADVVWVGAGDVSVGRSVFSLGRDGTAWAWRYGDGFLTGSELSELRQEVGLLKCATMAPDGESVAIGGEQGRVAVYRDGVGIVDQISLTNKDLAGPNHPEPSGPVVPSNLAFVSPDLLAIGFQGGTSIGLWSIGNGLRLAKPGFRTSGYVKSIQPCPSRDRLVAHTSGNGLFVVDATSAAVVLSVQGNVVENHAIPARFQASSGKLAVSSDGNMAAIGSDAGWVELWNLETGEETPLDKRFDHAIGGLSFTPDGLHLIAGGISGTVAVWRVADGVCLSNFVTDDVLGAAKPVEHGLHGGEIRDLVVFDDSKHFATASADGTVCLATIEGVGQLGSWFGGNVGLRERYWFESAVNSIAVDTSDGVHLIVGDAAGFVHRVPIEALEEMVARSDAGAIATRYPETEPTGGFRTAGSIRRRDPGLLPEAPSVLRINSDGHLYAGYSDGTIATWTQNSGTQISTVTQEGPVESMCLPALGLLVATIDPPNRVIVWSVLGEFGEIEEVHETLDTITAIADRGESVAVGLKTGSIWLPGENLVLRSDGWSPVVTLAVLPSGDFVCGTGDRRIQHRSAIDGEVIRSIKGFPDPIAVLGVGSDSRVAWGTRRLRFGLWDTDQAQPPTSTKYDSFVLDACGASWLYPDPLVLLAEEDGPVIVVNTVTRKLVFKTDLGLPAVHGSLAPNGRWFAVVDDVGSVHRVRIEE